MYEDALDSEDDDDDDDEERLPLTPSNSASGVQGRDRAVTRIVKLERRHTRAQQAVDAFDMDAEVEERAGAAVFQKLHPEEYYASFLKEGLRPDGRGLHDTRPLTISLGMLRT